MIGPYWLGDIPAEAALITVIRDPDATPLTDFDNAYYGIVDAAGVIVHSGAANIVDEQTLLLNWPTTSVFATRGVYSMQFQLMRTSPPAVETTSVLKFVVQERMTGWLTLQWVRDRWRDAPDSDEALFSVLEVARSQVEAWAPAYEGYPPINYREAQLMQARNIWNASKTDPSNFGIGDDGMVIRPFPMDWTVKNIIRPKVPKWVVA